MDWFLYDRDIRHERVKYYLTILEQVGFNNHAYEKDREICKLLLLSLVPGALGISGVPGIGTTHHAITVVILL